MPRPVRGRLTQRHPRMFRLLASLCLLPLCVAVTQATLDVLRAAAYHGDMLSPPVLAFAGGLFSWFLLYLFFNAPVKTYVFAHEMTHALWGLLFGARVSRLRVSEKGGSVNLTKSNIAISLAPYFFPFYTMVVVGLYLGIDHFWPLDRFYPVFLFAVAFTWAFHVTFTLAILRVRQPDIQQHGRCFSYTIIWLLNIAQVGLWIVCTTPVRLSLYWTQLTGRATGAYLAVWDAAVRAAQLLLYHALALALCHASDVGSLWTKVSVCPGYRAPHACKQACMWPRDSAAMMAQRVTE